jgi:hypothetical protein
MSTFDKWWVQVEIDVETGTEHSEMKAAAMAWEACEKKYTAIAELALQGVGDSHKVTQTLELIGKYGVQE